MDKTRSKLSFRIHHPNLDLSVACRQMGLTPTHIWKAGDQRRTPKGNLLPGYQDSSYCSVRFDDGTKGRLSSKIDSAIARLQPHRPVLNNLTSLGAKIEFFIGWFFAGDSGDTLESGTSRALADLGISLDINVYCCEDGLETAIDDVQNADA